MTGFMWKVGLMDKKLHIMFNRSDTAGTDLTTEATLENLTDAAGTVTKTGGVEGDYDGYLLSDKYFTGGCGAFGCTIQCPDPPNMADPDYAEYKINVCLIPWTDGEISPTQGLYGIYIENDVPNNRLVYAVHFFDGENFDDVVTTYEVTNNDDIYISLSEGKYNFMLARGLDTYSLHEFTLDPDDAQTNYYCAIALAHNNSVFKSPFYTPDPYFEIQTPTSNGNYHRAGNPYNMLMAGETVGDRVPTQVRIIMPDALQTILGFQNQPSGQTAISGVFTADQNIKQNFIPQNVKIELNNIYLDSYDSFTRGHRNILASIPKVVHDPDQEEILSYETDNPIFINIMNKQTMILNQVDVSVLDFQNNKISLEADGSDFTVLIK